LSAADAIDDVAVASIVLLWVTPVYDVDILSIVLDELVDTTTLFAQVAGANKQYKYTYAAQFPAFIFQTCIIDIHQ